VITVAKSEGQNSQGILDSSEIPNNSKSTEGLKMITKGKWQTGCDMSRVEVWPEGWNVPLLIADCGTKRSPELVEEQCANAQAISCLPDLIEALQEAYLQLQVHCDTNTAFTNDWRVMNIIKSVLLKAGMEVGE
jgi:hypothetical protein